MRRLEKKSKVVKRGGNKGIPLHFNSLIPINARVTSKAIKALALYVKA